MNFDIVEASSKLGTIDLKITCDNVMIDVLWIKAVLGEGNWIADRHMHSTYEFHFVRSGTFRVILDDCEFEAKEGEFFVTCPGEYHQQIGIGQEKCIKYYINCEFKVLEDKDTEMYHILNILKNTRCKKFKDSWGIINIFDNILSEAYYQGLGFYNNIKSFTLQAIIMTVREINGSLPIKYEIPVKKTRLDNRIEQIEKYILDNISKQITTRDIAMHMHLSEKQICRIVEERKGVSTKEFIMHIKHQSAKDLLKETSLSIKQVADKLGFSSEYYFGQFFKREEGYPPGIYRKNTRNV